MDDKLPEGVVLAIEQVVVGDSVPCLSCYFIEEGKNCPTEWYEQGRFVRSCTNNRDIYFKEIGKLQ